MKKLLLSLALTLIFISCNEKSTIEPIVNVEKDVSLKTNYDLPEITITGYRSYSDYTSYTDAFAGFYTLYIGNDYHVSSNPYKAFTQEYAGENINAIPGIKRTVLDFLNNKLLALNYPQFNDKEMVFLETLDVDQIFSVFSIMAQTYGLGYLALKTTFSGEAIDDGYSNAFMHVFMSNRMYILLGSVLGPKFVELHEANEKPSNSTNMDTNNNNLGISLAKQNTAVDYMDLYNLATGEQLWTINPTTHVLGKYRFVPKKPPVQYQN